jgi:hypothetical protein
MNVSKTSIVKCPNCLNELEGEAGDYVVWSNKDVDAGRATEQCGYCDAVFVATIENDDTVTIAFK